MKPRPCWKRGAILLQTLVMCIILSIISVHVLKWVLSRYIIVNRVKNSAVNTGNAQGWSVLGMQGSGTDWTTATSPPNKNGTIYNGASDVKTANFQSAGTGKFTTNVDNTDSY